MPKGPCSLVKSVPSKSSASSQIQSRNSRPTKRRFSMRSSRIIGSPLPRRERRGLDLFPRELLRLGEPETCGKRIRRFRDQFQPERALEQLGDRGDGTRSLTEETHDPFL